MILLKGRSKAMKIIVNSEDGEYAYIQQRDLAYLRQFYSGQVEYKGRTSDFIKITNPEMVCELKKMNAILDYCELMTLSSDKLWERYTEMKDFYNAKNTFIEEGIYRLDGLEHLYREKKVKEQSTFDIAANPLFYALEQLRDFILIRSEKTLPSIPAVILKQEFSMEILEDYMVYGTTNPLTIVLVRKDGQKLNLKGIDLMSVKTAIWLYYAQKNKILNGRYFLPENFYSALQMSDDERFLYIKTAKKMDILKYQNSKNKVKKKKKH